MAIKYPELLDPNGEISKEELVDTINLLWYSIHALQTMLDEMQTMLDEISKFIAEDKNA